MTPRFLDTNILIRLMAGDDEDKARRALSLLLRVEDGSEMVVTSPMVIFETIFVLEKTYDVPRAGIRDRLKDLLSLRGLRVSGKGVYARALDLYVEHHVSFADAYNAALMKSQGIKEIYTWDTDFDRLDGIARLEPGP